MIRICLLVPLTFFISTPHYLILAFHSNFYLSKYDGDLSVIWPVSVIILGIYISDMLIKNWFGSFGMLLISSVVFMLNGIAMVIASLADTPPNFYLVPFLLASLTIGMAQPNLATIVGDQFFPATVYHYLVYILIVMIGIFISLATSLTLNGFKDIECPINNCYSFVYAICSGATFMGVVIMTLMYGMHAVFLIEPLTHAPFHGNESTQLRTFLGITTPLLGIFIILLILERELFLQSHTLDLNIGGSLTLEQIHLLAVYYFLTILCLPVAMVLVFLKSNSFQSMSLGCVLICVASFYFGLFQSSYGTIVDNQLFKPINSTSIGFIMFNADKDFGYDFEPMGLQGNLPNREKTEQLVANQTDIIFNRVLLNGTTLLSTNITLSINDVNNKTAFGELVSIFNFRKGNFTYKERTYRSPSGYALLRILCNIKCKVPLCEANISIRSSKFEFCNRTSIYSIMEIPGDYYTITKDTKLVGTYYLGYGGYYALIIDNNSELYNDVPFVIIPPYKFSIYWHLLVYVLLAIAKGLIFGAGLDIAYQIGSDNQKHLFISALYVIYLIGWIFYQTIDDIYEFDVTNRVGITTFILMALTAWFYIGQHNRSYRLNKKEPESNNEE